MAPLNNLFDRFSPKFDCLTDSLHDLLSSQFRPYPVSIEAGQVPSCPWLVEHGEVNCTRRAPAKALYSFSAGPDGTSRLREFIRLPEQYPALSFLAECLESPRMAAEHVTNPQTNQTSDVVRAQGPPTGHFGC